MPVLCPDCYIPMPYREVLYALKERDMRVMFSVFISDLVDMMAYIEKNGQMLRRDIRTGPFDAANILSYKKADRFFYDRSAFL